MKNFVVGQTITNLACIGSDYVNSIGVIEGVGKDWLVVRSSDGEAHFVYGGSFNCLSTEDRPEERSQTVESVPVKSEEVFNPDSDHKDWNKFLCQHGFN